MGNALSGTMPARDRARYTTSVSLDINKNLSQGHSTILGGNDASISGGRRQRIAIARALYARPQLALFDDVLSALDAGTYQQVSDNVFGPKVLLRQCGSTVVFVAHPRDVYYADQIVALHNGGISIYEDPEQIRPSEMSLYDNSFSPHNATDAACLLEADQQAATLHLIYNTEHTVERRKRNLNNYAYYAKVAGASNMLLYAFCIPHWSFCSRFPSLGVQWWAEDNSRSAFRNLAMYISVYGILAMLGSTLWAVCMWLVFCNIVRESCKTFHQYLVTKIRDAPLFYLTSTDHGSIVNRFSQDMTLVDRFLPADFLKTSDNFVQCLMSAIFMSVTKYFAALIPLGVFVLYQIQRFYLRTSRQLHQLDLETKSSLYTEFTETISGVITIRAFGWQRYYQDEHRKLLQISQRPLFTLFAIQIWLILVFDLFVAGVAILLCLLAVLDPNIGPIGVSLILLVALSQQLTELINFWTSMETSIGAITRIRGFQDNVPCENLPSENEMPDSMWPSEGHIVLRDVTASYTLSAEQPVLIVISLTST